MRISTALLPICFSFLLFCEGCTQEESPPAPTKKQKIVAPIKKTVSKKTEAPLKRKTKEVKKETKKDTDTKIATIKERATAPSKIEAQAKEAVQQEEIREYYIVRKGDTLTSIAGRDDVYQNSLKWPILYRTNYDKLTTLQVGVDFLDSELSEGVRLKIITPSEVRENLRRNVHKIWVVNVFSTLNKKKIVPCTIKLIKNGYSAYITSASVKGKEWIRLRVGFFKNKAEADLERKKINTLLNINNSWISKASKELEEFGGY